VAPGIVRDNFPAAQINELRLWVVSTRIKQRRLLGVEL
jgi:hypothetical protein